MKRRLVMKDGALALVMGERGMTLGEVALRSSLSADTLRRAMSGEPVLPKTAGAIARAVRTPLNKLAVTHA